MQKLFIIANWFINKYFWLYLFKKKKQTIPNEILYKNTSILMNWYLDSFILRKNVNKIICN